MTREEARKLGYDEVMAGTARLYDLTGHMDMIGISQDNRGSFIAGVEDALEEQGFNIEGND